MQLELTGDDRWDAHLRELEELAAQTGHTRVPRTPTLRRLSIWLRGLRALRRRGELEPDRAAALEAQGMEWSPVFGMRKRPQPRRRRSPKA
ncbi:MAG: helicase associated domain-containing protein [Deltaproteobacteria bacterium]|nr:helicase associated domain-containing protein [Deltaproteobacteria bacterium]